jgi:hypothetical protein
MSRDVQEGSIDRQQSQVLPYCEQQEYEVVAAFKDEGSAAARLPADPA